MMLEQIQRILPIRKVRYTYKYRGYVAAIYRKGCMTIYDANGYEIFHTGHRPKRFMSPKDIEAIMDICIQNRQILQIDE